MDNVLILDNDLYFANTLKMYFQKHNINCTICNDGNLAVDYLNNNRYSLVICSTQLGHKSGMELSVLLKVSLSDKNTPFILITPNNNVAMNSDFQALEPDAILHKPISFPALMNIINEIRNKKVTA
jgi:DNA-binding response OmpR family regulator